MRTFLVTSAVRAHQCFLFRYIEQTFTTPSSNSNLISPPAHCPFLPVSPTQFFKANSQERLLREVPRYSQIDQMFQDIFSEARLAL